MLEKKRSSIEMSNNISERRCELKANESVSERSERASGYITDLLLVGWHSQTVSGKCRIYYIMKGNVLRQPVALFQKEVSDRYSLFLRFLKWFCLCFFLIFIISLKKTKKLQSVYFHSKFGKNSNFFQKTKSKNVATSF